MEGEDVVTYLDIKQLPLIGGEEQQPAIIPQALPFVKWAGGKRKILHHILSTAPATFKRYLEQFREDDQNKLAQVYNDLIALGAYPVLSNSYSELTLELYAQHNIKVVYANRNINHDGTGRAPIPEILVTPRISYGIHQAFDKFS